MLRFLFRHSAAAVTTTATTTAGDGARTMWHAARPAGLFYSLMGVVVAIGRALAAMFSVVCRESRPGEQRQRGGNLKRKLGRSSRGAVRLVRGGRSARRTRNDDDDDKTGPSRRIYTPAGARTHAGARALFTIVYECRGSTGLWRAARTSI